MMSSRSFLETEAPALPPLTRQDEVARILGRFKDQTVLVVGIGGGGDVVGTMPTCLDLESIGARAIPAGLTWKRVVHDSYMRPRPISQFVNFEQINDLIGVSNPSTRLIDETVHIESKLSKSLGGKPVVMIDPTPGTAKVREALLDYMKRFSIDAVVGVDAGGDVLCVGHEPTLESPLCDQVLLSAIAPLSGSLLGVFGFGADGEMPLTDLKPRFEQLHRDGSYLGTLPIAFGNISLMQNILLDAPTEASRLPIHIAKDFSEARLGQILHAMKEPIPNLEVAIGEQHFHQMRGGARTANLSGLSCTTMFFNPHSVFTTSNFNTIWDESKNIDQLHLDLTASGMKTEFTEFERLRHVAEKV